MAQRVDEQTILRIKELREKYGLSSKVIGLRLGLSERTVRYYLRAIRTGEEVYEAPRVKKVTEKEDDDLSDFEY